MKKSVFLSFILFFFVAFPIFSQINSNEPYQKIMVQGTPKTGWITECVSLLGNEVPYGFTLTSKSDDLDVFSNKTTLYYGDTSINLITKNDLIVYVRNMTAFKNKPEANRWQKAKIKELEAFGFKYNKADGERTYYTTNEYVAACYIDSLSGRKNSTVYTIFYKMNP